MHSDLVSLEGGKKEVTVTDVLSLETQVFWLSQRKDYNEELVLRKQLTFQNLNLTRYDRKASSLDKPLSVTPKTLSAWEGSCVFISCNIKEEFHDRRINQWSFVWYFQPSFDKSLNDYSGTLLYSSNQTATEVSSEFSNRVQFVGDLGSKNCSLKISQLHLSDNGSYGIRLYWIPGELKTSDKWFEILEVIVHKTPSELIKTVSPEMIEGNNYTVACSIPYYCYDELIKLSIQGLEDHHVSPPKMTTEIQTVQTTFMATWKDHGKQLTCLLKTHDGREMKKSFANLTVKYVPKGVKVNAEPGGTVREGNKLTLECIVNSSNPPVFSYWWYKNGESWNTKQWGSRRDFYSLKGTDSGSYRCEVNNGIGRVDSDNLTINVQYPPKVNIIKSQSLIQEKDSVVLTCSATGNPPIDGYKWYKSSTPGFIVDRQELRIGAIQPNDSDTYLCGPQQDWKFKCLCHTEHCPKDVQLFLLNHLPIKEGDKVILNCSVGSSYPSNNNYKFFGASGDLLRSWGSTLIVFAIPAPITSYKCEACNSVGCTFSPTITLDVLYAPKDVQLVILNDLPIKEGDTIRMNCSFGSSKPNDNWYNWFKSDPSTIEYKYSGPNVMTYPATHGPYNTSYECEGWLHCIASGYIGGLLCSQGVKILQKPVGRFHEPALVYLKCEVEIARHMTFKWYKNEKCLWRMHSDLVSLKGGKKEVTVTDVLSLETQVFWLSQRKDYNEELVLRKQLTFQNLNLTRLKLTMRCFLWMLFLPGYCCKGSLDKPLSVTPKTLSAWEGSCVFISCNIKEEFHRRINQWSFVWYFQPSFDQSLNDYSGTLLYSSNQTATEVSSEFSNRVQFVGDLGSKNCSLKISQLHLSDNGSYGIRLYWVPGELKTSDKWFETLEIIKPFRTDKTVSPEMIEGNNYTVACSIPYYCYDEPIELSIQGLESHHVSPPKMTTEIQTMFPKELK
ncbi:hypothetical protein E2320_000597 [Naja naja]|nr:hypothetical protein E2320_000597 [Naja naja]